MVTLTLLVSATGDLDASAIVDQCHVLYFLLTDPLFGFTIETRGALPRIHTRIYGGGRSPSGLQAVTKILIGQI